VLRIEPPRKPLPPKLELRPPNPLASVWLPPMLPLNPRLPLTDLEAPPNDPPLAPPAIETCEPNRDDDPIADEFSECEPAIFEAARPGDIAELRPAADDDPVIPPRPFDAADAPAREFDATIGALFACVPAVFPVLGPRALPLVLPPFRATLALPPRAPAFAPPPENECQLPSAFA
jgi:hypothetical protein